MNKDNLWSQRFSTFIYEILKYVRFILTGHFVIVLVFLAGWGAFEYQKWLQVVRSDFPAEILTTVVITLLVLWSPIQTFLKNADVVFLTPMEARMKGYIVNSLIFSFAWQSVMLFLVFLVFVPLLHKINGDSFNFWGAFGAILFTKLINIIIHYFENSLTKTWENTTFLFSRIVISFGIVFLVLERDYFNVYTVLLVFIMLINVILNLIIVVKGKPLPWLKLIENDNRFMYRFYRFANLFTDVPQLQNRIIERKWLNFLLKNKKLTHSRAMDYLFLRTFIRSNEYFGLYARLTLITVSLLSVMNPGMLAILIGMLSIYLVGFQLLSMARHYEFQLWLDIYPIPQSQIKTAVIVLLRKVLLVQNVILSITMVLAVDIRTGLMSFFACIAFILLFLEYAKNKI
ncbi:MAG: transporter permease [Bacillales bacterium]|jgi:ABC-2 type transport system permease protein|nr:transporter permease [Bacillales bacterium]